MLDFANAPSGQYPYLYEKHRALSAFRNHVVKIEHDDGVNRSILFKDPASSFHHFRLATWPGHLAMTGDMGSYIFSRTYDMFDFFIQDKDPASAPIEINASYWAEKLQATDTRSDLRPESVDVGYVKKAVIEAFRELEPEQFALKRKGGEIATTPEGNPRTDRLEAFRALRWDFLNDLSEDDDAGHVRAQLNDLSIPSYYLESDAFTDHQLMTDVWEMSISNREYGFTYLLSCYAIVWGIKRYFQVKEQRDTASRFAAIYRPQPAGQF